MKWRACSELNNNGIKNIVHENESDDQQTGGPALLADRGLRLREGRIGPDLVGLNI